MDELTHIIAKYSPEPEMLLLLIFLFALGKSVIVVSSALPPASVTLLVGILAGKHTLPLGAVWAAIALGATLGSILSFHGGALLCRHDLGRRLPARFHTPLHKAQRSLQKRGLPLLFASRFPLCDAIPDLIVFSDELNHASMIYGIRYSKAEKKIFRHNDVAHLAELLQAADPARPKLIAFESLYSMDGDFAPLAQIVALAEQYQALTYLDEIHSAGVYGERGLGYAEQLGLLDKITIIQGGFGKSYGAAGGYIAAPRSVVEAVRSWAPAFVFSTSSPAPVVAAALASFKYNLEHDTQRKLLLAIVDHLKTGLRAAGIPLVSADSHILPLLVGDPHRNKHISKVLLDEHDIYVQPVNAPTVPAGSERLRVTPTSAHSHADVETFLAALGRVWAANDLRRAG